MIPTKASRHHGRRRTVCGIGAAFALILPAILCLAPAGSSDAPGAPRSAYSSWWDPDWQCRRPVTVTCQASGSIPGFQLLIGVTYSSEMRQDFSDLRFVQYNASSSQNDKLKYWIESCTNGASAGVWVRLETLLPGTTSFYMYFGNAYAASESSVEGVFDFHDDFSGNSIDAAKWSVDDSSGWSVSGGELRGTTTTGVLHSKASLFSGCIAETRTRGTSYAGNSHNPLSAWASTSDLLGFYWGYTSGGWGFYSFYADGFPSQNYNWMSADSKAVFQLVMRPDNTNDLVKRDYDTYAFKEAWSDSHQKLGKTVSGDERIRLGRRCDDGYRYQGYDACWDWVRVRKCASQDPTYAFGGKEYPIRLESLSFHPSGPSERDKVTLNATFYNPTGSKITIRVSFHEGEDFDSSELVAARDATLNPRGDTVVSATWTAVGGDHTLWAAAFDLPVGSVNVSVNRDPRMQYVADQTLTQGKLFRLQLSASDPDSDPLAWSSDSPLFAVNATGNSSAEMAVLPSNEDVGFHAVTVAVTDPHGRNASRRINFTVKNVNDPPELAPIPDRTVLEGALLEFSVSAADPDLMWGDALRFSDDTELFDIDAETGAVAWRPTEAQVGEHAVKISVHDNRSAVDSANFTLTVVNVNEPPRIAEIPPLYAWQGRPFSHQVEASDSDLQGDNGERLGFLGQCGLFAISPEGLIAFTATNDQLGVHEAKITVTDRAGAQDQALVRITVLNVNDPPSLAPIPDQSVMEDQPFRHQANASDPDLRWGLDNLTFSDDSGLFDIDRRTGAFSLTARGSHVGEHRITITVTDEGNARSSASFLLRVVHVNHAPYNARISSPVNGTQFREGQRISLTGAASDRDAADRLEYSWSDNGRPLGEGRNLTIKLGPGRHVLTLEVSDGTDSARVQTTVEVAARENLTADSTWGLAAAAVAVAAACAAAAFVVFGMRRRKGAAKTAAGERPAGRPASPAAAPAPDAAAAAPGRPADDGARDRARRALIEAEDLVSDLLVDGIDAAGPMRSLELAREFQNDGDFPAALEFAEEARTAAEAARERDAPAKKAAAGRTECPACGEPLEPGWGSCPACMRKL